MFNSITCCYLHVNFYLINFKLILATNIVSRFIVQSLNKLSYAQIFVTIAVVICERNFQGKGCHVRDGSRFPRSQSCYNVKDRNGNSTSMVRQLCRSVYVDSVVDKQCTRAVLRLLPR